MGNTPNGLPYPEGTDLVMNGDDAIKALATALRITSGGANLPVGSSVQYVTMTFPAGLFVSAPWATFSVSNPFLSVGQQAISATSVSVAAFWRNADGTIGSIPSGHIVRYIAVRVGAV